MDRLNELEAKVLPLYKDAPHLPKNGQQWLADNIWWIILVFVIIGAFGVLGLLSVAFVSGALLTAYGGVFGAVIGGFAVIIALLALGLSLINLVIGAIAISPLKSKQKKGWSLLFLTLLISAASAAIMLVFAFDFISFVRESLFIVIGGYFLFEVRDYFDAAHANGHASEATAAKAK